MRKISKSITSCLSRGAAIKITLLPAALNSVETAFSPSITETAKETNVGGTVLSMNVPDILSLPPIAAIPRASWTIKAPNSALKGWPQVSTLFSFGKYSCNVR